MNLLIDFWILVWISFILLNLLLPFQSKSGFINSSIKPISWIELSEFMKQSQIDWNWAAIKLIYGGAKPI